LKKDVRYFYSGPRTKDGIMDFANRVGGPLIRPLNSLQLFQHAMNRHDVMFVYVGATSQLKGNYTSAAEELIVHTFFFSSSRDVLPKVVSLPSLPAVVVFKDGTFFTFDEERDGDLKSWINRERFPNFFRIDSYTLYAMGDSGNLTCPLSPPVLCPHVSPPVPTCPPSSPVLCAHVSPPVPTCPLSPPVLFPHLSPPVPTCPHLSPPVLCPHLSSTVPTCPYLSSPKETCL
ncbi:protein disulfide-isomerase TMX3-like, partial [Epinephelus moara]|uniref:protein disulfide-isomerase TMX3-like n=1 Tax=Epinephelus moara TaxID=300413 RepID=UPI00214E9C93